ncbi:MAG: lipid II flippase MurJ, partial [Candidatus Binataceae bacterium]
VWAVLAGTAVGLLAITMGRLYNSAYYALNDTRTPLKFAIIRFLLTIGLGYFCALPLPGLLGIAQKWGVAGLTVSAGLAGWVEFTLLRRSLNLRIGWTGLERAYIAKLWLYAVIAVAAALAVQFAMSGAGPRLTAVVVIPVYGAVYLGLGWWTGMPELEQATAYLMRRLGKRR